MLADDITKREGINSEENGTKDRALGDTAREGFGWGLGACDGNKLGARKEVRSKPSQSGVRKTNPMLQSVEKNGVIHSVERS